MELYFLRHGKAVDPGRDAPDDFSRALTPGGIKELESLADVLHSLDVAPDIILTSPLVRAKQTAEIIARRLTKKKSPIETNLLAPTCNLTRLRQLLDGHRSARAIMIVGHEPDFSDLIGELISPRGASVEMKKAGLALVEVDGSITAGAGTLRWLVPPKVLLGKD